MTTSCVQDRMMGRCVESLNIYGLPNLVTPGIRLESPRRLYASYRCRPRGRARYWSGSETHWALEESRARALQPIRRKRSSYVLRRLHHQSVGYRDGVSASNLEAFGYCAIAIMERQWWSNGHYFERQKVPNMGCTAGEARARRPRTQRREEQQGCMDGRA